MSKSKQRRPTRLKLELATTADAVEIAAVRRAVSEKLTVDHGEGPWSGKVSEKGVLLGMRIGNLYVARQRGRIVATATLATKKPWAIDTKYFTQAARPLYLTAMAVAPDSQRQGLGRRCMQTLIELGKQLQADAIRLDAYNAEAGAGEFYHKCGLVEVGRVTYREAPLIYYELVL
jgi:GNAT superfamily N-acetyltransferase